jgi:hypothetical protein
MKSYGDEEARANGWSACKEITYLKYGSSITSGSRIEAESAGGQIVWNEMSLNIPEYMLETGASLRPVEVRNCTPLCRLRDARVIHGQQGQKLGGNENCETSSHRFSLLCEC